MCHFPLSSSNASDFDARVVLAMTRLTPVMLASSKFNNFDLLGAAVFDNGGRYLSASNERRANFDVLAVAKHQYFGEFYGFTERCIQHFDAEFVPLAHVVLLATSLYYEIHERVRNDWIV
ncbi:MAG: hypothetical protein ACI915_004043 [Gammaproteobacteria bacterium]|jgi:hypothetical protein